MHTDQYLHWDSNHFITAKNSVYNTLVHRAKVVSSTPAELVKELDYLRKVFQACLFPNWPANKQHQFEHKHNNRDTDTTEEQYSNHHNSSNNINYKQHKNISIHGLEGKFKNLQQTRHPSSFQGNQCH